MTLSLTVNETLANGSRRCPSECMSQSGGVSVAIAIVSLFHHFLGSRPYLPVRLPRQLGVKLVNPIKQHVSDTERDAGNGMDNDLQPLSQFLPAQETSRNAATRLI